MVKMKVLPDPLVKMGVGTEIIAVPEETDLQEIVDAVQNQLEFLTGDKVTNPSNALEICVNGALKISVSKKDGRIWLLHKDVVISNNLIVVGTSIKLNGELLNYTDIQKIHSLPSSTQAIEKMIENQIANADKTQIAQEAASLIDTSLLSAIGSGVIE